jgi:hypothetical protein
VRLWTDLKILVNWGRLGAQYVKVVYVQIKTGNLGLCIVSGGGIVLRFIVICVHGTGLGITRLGGFAWVGLLLETVGSMVPNFSSIETAVFFELFFLFSFGQGASRCSV